VHGKGVGHCRASPFAVHPDGMHGNAAFFVCFAFAMPHMTFHLFFFLFYFI
jgi:hypothetical protein